MRRQVTYTVQADGRDQGKVFQLTEMPAAQAEKWAIRALLALGRGGIDLPPGIEREGMGAMARVGLEALMKIDFLDAEPLLDEMMRCVSIVRDPLKAKLVDNNLTPDDIEEVVTYVLLRREVFRLHTGF